MVQSSIFKKAVRKVNTSSNFFRYSSPNTREFYFNSRCFFGTNNLKNRINLGSYFSSLSTDFRIKDEEGYLVIPPFSISDIEESVAYAEEIFLEHHKQIMDEDPEHSKKYRKKNAPFYVLPITKSEHDLNLNSPFMRLAMNSKILSIVSDYMGMMPIISSIGLWYSPNKQEKLESSSREFHLDHADVRQVKIFIAVDDIDKDTGPLLLVNSTNTSKVVSSINYNLRAENKRVDDEVIEDILGSNQINPMVGKSGSLIFADTSRCFHAGSRKASKPRKIISIQYLSPYAFQYPLRGINNVAKYSKYAIGKSTLLKLILGNHR
tara:strand:+ start:578 stop:1540 length:963 start_codon:yes stop_codon:yes gene_type:complete